MDSLEREEEARRELMAREWRWGKNSNLTTFNKMVPYVDFKHRRVKNQEALTRTRGGRPEVSVHT